MKIVVNNRNINFAKFQIPDSFSRNFFLADDFLDNRPYLLDYDLLKLDKTDLLWLVKNKVNCIVLISSKSWDTIKGIKSEKGIEVINKSSYVSFFELIKMIIQERDRDKVYLQLLIDEPAPVVIQRWLLSVVPLDRVVLFLDTILETQEVYYKTLAYCFTPRSKIPTYKLHKPSEEEESLRLRIGGSFWEMHAYEPLLKKRG